MSSFIRRPLIVALFGFACLAGNVGAAEPNNPDAANYTKVAAAKAKAEVAMKTLAPLADNRANGVDQARMRADLAARKVLELIDVRIRTEEQRGESKDQTNLDNLRKTRTGIETKIRDGEPSKRTLELKSTAVAEAGNRMRELMSATENLERQLKSTDLDVASVIPIYTEIETKALSVAADATSTINESTAVATEWSATLKANE